MARRTDAVFFGASVLVNEPLEQHDAASAFSLCFLMRVAGLWSDKPMNTSTTDDDITFVVDVRGCDLNLIET